MPFNADRNAIFARLEATAARANLTREERARYEEEWKNYNDLYNTMDFAEAKGRKEGRKEGREEGRVEEKLSIACQLKLMGLPATQISQATGLTLEEIEKL